MVQNEALENVKGKLNEFVNKQMSEEKRSKLQKEMERTK